MIENIVTEVAGLVGVLPKVIYIETNNTLAEVIVTGFLNHAAKQGYQFSEYEMALVSTKLTPSASAVQLAWFQIDISGPNISLVSPSGPGSVVLPTIANHIAIYTNASGQLSEDAATAINGGNIQAGLSGTAGYLASFPSASLKGSLRVVAVANTNNTLVTISNALHGQASVYSIPDSGAATANFIISALSGTQHITVGALQVDAGVISSGLSTGGTAGGFIAYPSVTTNGSFRFVPVGNAGNFAMTLSPISSLGQASVITVPDPGASTASFLLSVSAAGQSVASSSASATPGTIRALRGLMTLSNATYANTTNSVAGVRGEVDMVGASSGYVYGVQGKVIPTGTLSGSIWAPAVFGQYDLSGATINAGQIAAIWGDMGATGGVFTDVTGARMFAGTNTIASLTLNSMIYLYGKASNLFELSGSSSTYIAAAGGVTPSGTNKTIKITIDGVDYYILASTVYS